MLCISTLSCSDDDAYGGSLIYFAPPPASAPLDDAGSEVAAPWLIQSGDAVFFIGNSFFDYQGRVLPDWVTAVGQSMNPPITIATGACIVPGTKPLSWFFQQPASVEAIASGRYKVFVVQGEDTEPVDDKQNFQDAVRAYYNAITQAGGRMLLFMTWDFVWNKDNPDFFNQLSNAYEEIGAELHIPIIPVGLIWNDCNEHPFPGEQPYFLNGQDLHETESGSAANAYATFAMLTGINPKGVQFQAEGNTNSPELLRYLSHKAWFRVAMRLRD